MSAETKEDELSTRTLIVFNAMSVSSFTFDADNRLARTTSFSVVSNVCVVAHQQFFHVSRHYRLTSGVAMLHGYLPVHERE